MDEHSGTDNFFTDIQKAFRLTIDTYMRGEVRATDAEAYLVSLFAKQHVQYLDRLLPELIFALARLGRVEKEPSGLGSGLWALHETFLDKMYQKDKEKTLWFLIEATDCFPAKGWLTKRAREKLKGLWNEYLVSEDQLGYFGCARIDNKTKKLHTAPVGLCVLVPKTTLKEIIQMKGTADFGLN